jgi:hypothetical protein
MGRVDCSTALTLYPIAEEATSKYCYSFSIYDPTYSTIFYNGSHLGSRINFFVYGLGLVYCV